MPTLQEKIIAKMPKIEKAHTYASENADVYRVYDKGQENMLKRSISSLPAIIEVIRGEIEKMPYATRSDCEEGIVLNRGDVLSILTLEEKK